MTRTQAAREAWRRTRLVGDLSPHYDTARRIFDDIRAAPELDGKQISPEALLDITCQAIDLLRNLAARTAVGHAVPSVAPGQAAKYLHKVECFCFNEQLFEAGETRDMPVRFILDPELPAHIDTVTLSYTFFEKLAAQAD